MSLEVGEYLHDAHQILRQKIEDKYIDKIISGVGLVVLVDEITNTSKPRILPNDASALFNLSLKLLVYAPERDERITGKIVTMDSSGIGISLGFFNDIKIIPQLMPVNSKYDTERRTWYREANGTKQFLKVNTTIQFTVVDVIYNEMNDASPDDQMPVMLVLGTVK